MNKFQACIKMNSIRDVANIYDYISEFIAVIFSVSPFHCLVISLAIVLQYSQRCLLTKKLIQISAQCAAKILTQFKFPGRDASLSLSFRQIRRITVPCYSHQKIVNKSCKRESRRLWISHVSEIAVDGE